MKKLISMVLVVVLVMLSCPAVFAEETATQKINGLTVVSQEEATEIEQLIAINNNLNLELEKASKTRADTSKITREIEMNNQKIADLGAHAPSDELLEKLVIASMSQSDIMPCALWHPSDIVEGLKSMYDLSHSYSTIYNGKQQYHLIFRHNGNDLKLSRVKTDHFYDKIDINSKDAYDYLTDVISFVFEYTVSSLITEVYPSWVMIPAKMIGVVAASPEETSITSSGNALVVTANTAAIQKFVFIYDEANDDWFYALSTNMVTYALSFTQAVTVDGRAINYTNTYTNMTMNGAYYSALADSDSAFDAGLPRFTCIYELAGYSDAKNKKMMNVKIHSPKYVIDMVI